MGAPLLALNIVAWPVDDLPLEMLGQVLQGGVDVASKAGAAILGGHTITDPEPKYGMVALGLADPERDHAERRCREATPVPHQAARHRDPERPRTSAGSPTGAVWRRPSTTTTLNEGGRRDGGRRRRGRDRRDGVRAARPPAADARGSGVGRQDRRVLGAGARSRLDLAMLDVVPGGTKRNHAYLRPNVLGASCSPETAGARRRADLGRAADRRHSIPSGWPRSSPVEASAGPTSGSRLRGRPGTIAVTGRLAEIALNTVRGIPPCWYGCCTCNDRTRTRILRRDGRARTLPFPNEACGLLAGKDGRPVKFFPMTNQDASPVRYRLDPKEQLTVFDEIDDEGWTCSGSSARTRIRRPSPVRDRPAAGLLPGVPLPADVPLGPSQPVPRFRIEDGEVTEDEVAIGRRPRPSPRSRSAGTLGTSSCRASAARGSASCWTRRSSASARGARLSGRDVPGGRRVGTLGIVDFDKVDESNLQRQIVHSTADVGRPKVESAADRLRAINPTIEIVPYDTILSSQQRDRDPRALGRGRRRDRQLPGALPRERRDAVPRQAARVRVDLPVGRPGHGLHAGAGRPVLPVPVPAAAAPRHGPELRRGRGSALLLRIVGSIQATEAQAHHRQGRPADRPAPDLRRAGDGLPDRPRPMGRGLPRLRQGALDHGADRLRGVLRAHARPGAEAEHGVATS